MHSWKTSATFQDNIKMTHEEIRLDLTDSGQGSKAALVMTVIKLKDP